MYSAIITVAAISYLIGAIPFSLIIGKLWGADIRTNGSGNIGAKNVLRTCGKAAGALALVCDVAKGAIPILLADWLFSFSTPDPLLLAGIFAVLGHGFPVFLKFKGGKCIATSTGAMLVLAPAALLSTALVFGLGLLFLRKVAVLGSVFVVLLFPVFMIVYYRFLPGLYGLTYQMDLKYLLAATLFLMALVTFKHIPNFKKMRDAGKIHFKW